MDRPGITDAWDLYDGDWININLNLIHKTAIIHPCVTMGTGNVIGPYTCIGLNGEIRGVKVFNGTVELGSDNVISEHVTIQRPELGVTKVGDRNIIMAHAHIGHDAIVGSDCEICTTSVIGGYVCIEDKVKVKLHSVIRNRITLGEGCLVGMGSVVVKSVEKGQVVMGNPARVKQE